MYNHILYLLYWTLNSLIIYLFGSLFPDFVVLGNYRFTGVESAIYAGFWVTVFFWAMWDFLLVKGVVMSKLTGAFWVFFSMNFVSVWLVSRFSHIAGMGLTSFLWAFLIAFISNLAQKAVWKLVTKEA